MDQRNAEAAPAVSGTAPDPDRMPLMPALQDALPYPVESLALSWALLLLLSQIRFKFQLRSPHNQSWQQQRW